jgi:hypothetical protein
VPSDNPRTVAPAKIAALKAMPTYVGGREAFCDPGMR